MVYGLAVVGAYGAHKDDEFQDYFIAFGVIVGLLVSGIVAVEGGAGAIKDYVTALLTLSLAGSLIFHRIYHSF